MILVKDGLMRIMLMKSTVFHRRANQQSGEDPFQICLNIDGITTRFDPWGINWRDLRMLES